MFKINVNRPWPTYTISRTIEDRWQTKRLSKNMLYVKLKIFNAQIWFCAVHILNSKTIIPRIFFSFTNFKYSKFGRSNFMLYWDCSNNVVFRSGVLPPSLVISLISVLLGPYPALVAAATVIKYFVAGRRFLMTAVYDWAFTEKQLGYPDLALSE